MARSRRAKRIQVAEALVERAGRAGRVAPEADLSIAPCTICFDHGAAGTVITHATPIDFANAPTHLRKAKVIVVKGSVVTSFARR